jgi:hypothetical protein
MDRIKTSPNLLVVSQHRILPNAEQLTFMRSTPTAVYESISTRKNKKGRTVVLHSAVICTFQTSEHAKGVGYASSSKEWGNAWFVMNAQANCDRITPRSSLVSSTATL